MTNLQLKKLTRRFRLSVLTTALFGLVFISSCNQQGEGLETPENVATLKIIHSLPNFASLDFYLDGQKMTSYALLYSQATGYGSIYTGNHTVDVAVGGTNQGISRNAFNFEADKSYSLFVTRISPSNDTIMAKVTVDDLTDPPAGKAKVRFVHLSQNAPSLDLAVQGGSTLFSNRAFNSVTEFISIDPGSLTFQIKDTGTSSVRASSAQAITIQAGGIYTLWAEGLVNGNGQNAIGIQIMEN